MKKSNPWWWNKMTSKECTSGAVVLDYLLSECGALELVSEMEDRFFCGPGEDIWKKLPTPPRSPNRNYNSDDESSCVAAEAKLNLVSDHLDCPSPVPWGLCSVPPNGLKNDLLHDCMWSGQCTDTCKRGHTSLVIPEPFCQRLVTPIVKTEPETVDTAAPAATLSVDPYTMLPYTPLSDHSYHTQQQLLSRCGTQPRTPPVCDTPSDTEDDEIDVVTLPTSAELTATKLEPVQPYVKAPEPASTRKRPPGRPRTVPPLRVVIPSSALVSKLKERRSPGRKRFHKRLNGSATSNVTSSNGAWHRRHYKRRFSTHRHNFDRSVSCSSDSEDCVEKRSMHNSMERKRRDDLRFAFQTLREHVPELASNPKAPKVLILTRAASYARQLSQTGAALEKTLKQETKRRNELQRKLMQLNKLK